MASPDILLPDDLGLHDVIDGAHPYSASRIPSAEALARVRFFVPVYMGSRSTFAIAGQMPELAVVQSLTAGVDHLRDMLPPHVLLARAGGVHDASTAELAVGLILTSLRRLDEFARAMPAGAWEHGRHEALADKRILIIGAGEIGSAIARRLAPFEVAITLVGRRSRPGVEGVERVRALLPAHDVVVLAVPLDSTTRGMVDGDFLAAMPSGALLVNVARGPVVDSAALLDAVSNRGIRAALDVVDPEPLPPEHPLWRLPGVFVSPHVGGNSTAFLPRARDLVSRQIDHWRRGEPLAYVVR